LPNKSGLPDIFPLRLLRISSIFLKRNWGKKTAREAINHLLHIFYPATVTDNNIYQALDIEWDDFEDSVQYIVGEGLAVDYIVTRNTQDFTTGSIDAVTPEQFIEIITNPNEQ
jgi:hypothetical protein